MALEVWRDGSVGAKRLKALEDENRKLKKLLAESMLDVADAPRDARKKLLTPGSRRSAVSWAIEHRGYAQRRACSLDRALTRASTATQSRRPDDAGSARNGCGSSASERRRFGYRRLHILLQREGHRGRTTRSSIRLYREERLTVRKRGGRKRAFGTRAPMAIPQGSEPALVARLRVRCLVDGRRFRILCVIDDFSRECLATVVDNSLSGRRVARELDAIAERRAIHAWWSVTTAPS